MPEPERRKSPANAPAKGVVRALPRLGRPPRGKTLISEERMLKLALAIVDEGGAGALTMRALAERLGVTAMSLYRYCDNHEGLLDAVHRQILDQHPTLPISADQSYRQVLTETAKALRRAIVAHPKAASLFATRDAIVPTHREQVLMRLSAAGFERSIAQHLLDAVVAFTLGLSLSQYAGPQSVLGSDDHDTSFVLGLLAVIDGFANRYGRRAK